ncbi:uncharacterized protein LOC126682032 [Mercurialis annua]|uniref:uncharacterized protein LOC126682032 n=1 Tax=Mercurialis annua TaxID=3986 RepID=UPI00215FA846|nr:uncharacterized protein LOC126682032 [Mercurialis annua]
MRKKSFGHKPDRNQSSVDTRSDMSNTDIVGDETTSRQIDDSPAVETTDVMESSELHETALNKGDDAAQQNIPVEQEDSILQPVIPETRDEALDVAAKPPRAKYTKLTIIQNRFKNVSPAVDQDIIAPETVVTESQQSDQELSKPASRYSKRLKNTGTPSFLSDMAKLKASYTAKKQAKQVSDETNAKDSVVDELVVPEIEIQKKVRINVKRKVTFESTDDDSGADKTDKQSPIKKKLSSLFLD